MSKELAYTKGGWIVSKLRSGKHDDVCELYISHGDGHRVICEVRKTYYPNDMEHEANAKLISQAPAMYELLKEMNSEITSPMQFIEMQRKSLEIIKKIES